MEKYITVSLGRYIVFKDSLMFLNTALDTLGRNLLAGGVEKFVHLRAELPSINDEKLQLLMRKGVFPYDYIDSWDRMVEEQLPPKEAFFNKLKDTDISDDDYKHAQTVWQTFHIKNLYSYLYLYLECMCKFFPSVYLFHSRFPFRMSLVNFQCPKNTSRTSLLI